MILSKNALEYALQNDHILCKPSPKYIGPNSIDLTLGDKMKLVDFNTIEDEFGPVVNTSFPGKSKDISFFEKNGLKYFVLYPGYVYLGHTEEVIGSKCYVPIVETRSTVARHGISTHHAGFCDLGFEGQITLEMVNFSPYPALIEVGFRVAQVYFEEATVYVRRGFV